MDRLLWNRCGYARAATECLYRVPSGNLDISLSAIVTSTWITRFQEPFPAARILLLHLLVFVPSDRGALRYEVWEMFFGDAYQNLSISAADSSLQGRR